MRDKDEKRWGRTLRQRAREEQRKNRWGGTTKWSSDRRAVKLDWTGTEGILVSWGVR